jgi:hypothetical protein
MDTMCLPVSDERSNGTNPIHSRVSTRIGASHSHRSGFGRIDSGRIGADQIHSRTSSPRRLWPNRGKSYPLKSNRRDSHPFTGTNPHRRPPRLSRPHRHRPNRPQSHSVRTPRAHRRKPRPSRPRASHPPPSHPHPLRRNRLISRPRPLEWFRPWPSQP